jgi:ComF family protein
MQALTSIVSSLFVPHCASCDVRVPIDLPLCPPCAVSLDELGPACPRCGELQAAPPSVECARCRTTDWPLTAMVAPWRYGGELGRALRRLKFSARPSIARDLAPLYAPFLKAAVIHGEIDVIVPIPLHARRMASRGFNQSDALARHARREGGLATRIDGLALRRVIATVPQTHLSADDRRANVAGAFVVRHPLRVVGKRVLLFDDVVATGATMAEAARALLRAGATTVVGFAAARAE